MRSLTSAELEKPINLYVEAQSGTGKQRTRRTQP